MTNENTKFIPHKAEIKPARSYNINIDEPKEYVTKLYIGFNDYPNYHDEDVNKYMLKAYDAIPANAITKEQKRNNEFIFAFLLFFIPNFHN